MFAAAVQQLDGFLKPKVDLAPDDPGNQESQVLIGSSAHFLRSGG